MFGPSKLEQVTMLAKVDRLFVAVTDRDWYEALRRLPHLDEVNFWQPRPSGVADTPGTPWLFKLHAPHHYIVGGGFFTYYTSMPAGVAWETFAERNGVSSFFEMLSRVARYSKVSPVEVGDVGCVILSQPFFMEPDAWVPAPETWKSQIVRGRHFSRTDADAAALWNLVITQANASRIMVGSQLNPFGNPILISPRLGQGDFRARVTDAYSRRCAVTAERTVPALEAAHTKPFQLTQTHDITNGVLLRSDIHKLFDLGYVTVRPDFRFRVSKSIRDEFENGRDYYAMDGRELSLPDNPLQRPNAENLEWHYEERFRK